MNRVSKCLYFQNKNMLKNTFLYVLYYTLAVLLLMLLPIIFKGLRIGGNAYGKSNFYLPAGIFTFAYIVSTYKETFNYLLLFGNTRKTIFISSIVTNTAMSLLLAVISLISTFVEAPIANWFGYDSIGTDLLDFIYQSNSWASKLLFIAAFLILLAAFSMLYGALSYKLGKVFTIVFWVAFGVAFVSLPIVAANSKLNFIIIAIDLFFCFEASNGILLASINFILLALIFSSLTYLLSRRQPQVD